MSVLTTLHTHFHRHHLLLARLGWAAVLLLNISIMAANLPHVYMDTRLEWQVRQALPAALRLFPSGAGFYYTIITLRLVTASIFVLTALFLAWRKWNDWFVLYISATLLMLAILFGTHFNVEVIRYPGRLETVPAFRALVPSLIIGSLVLLFFLFPNGRFTPRWLVWLVWPAIFLITTVFIKIFFFPPERGAEVSSDSSLGWMIFVFTLLVTIGLGLINQFARYWRISDAAQRQQTKWVLLGLTALLVVPLLDWVLFALFDLGDESLQHLINLILSIIIPALLPLTIALATLRYRLWAVDIWINRAVVYGGFTAVIFLLYGLSVGLLSTFVPGNTDLLIPFIALTAAVLIAIPARRTLQRLTNRWLPHPIRPPRPTDRHIPTTTLKTGPRSSTTLIQLLWLALFAFLCWQMFHAFRNIDTLLAFQRNEWSVRESLKALPNVSASGLVIYLNVLRLATAGCYWLTAVFIFWRKRRDHFALTVSGLHLLLPFSIVLGDIQSSRDILDTVELGAMLLLLLLPFFFPDGRLVPQTTRWRLILAAYLLGIPTLIFTLLPYTMPQLRGADVGWMGLILSVTAILLAGLLSQFVRYRRLADEVQRQQMKWVFFGGFGALGVMFLWMLLWTTGILAWIGISEGFSTLITLHLVIFASAALPISIGVSILRYRLWDVDILINRTLVFGGLTLLVTAVYILTVGLLSNLLQSGSSILLSVLATGLIAILFNPLRQRLQTAVNRLMYGERDDPLTVLSSLGKRLEKTAVPGETLPVFVETIAQTLKLPYVAITVEDDVIASAGTEWQTPIHQYPLIYQSQPIGRLLVAARASGEDFAPHEEQLLRNVARQAGPAVYAEQLTTQLQRARERLVTTREEERRRLRHDLHDGLGPRLATLTIKINAVQNLLRTDPNAAEQLLSEVKTESQSAIKEIRRVVEGLRPSALDQLGLVSALREFVIQSGNGRTQITFQAPDQLPPLPAAVEVATYRIATEAVTNTMRHADAHICTIQLEINGCLHLTIRDDGVGLPAGYKNGVGLTSMRERAAELGGRFEIHSTPNRGTTLTVQLPLQ